MAVVLTHLFSRPTKRPNGDQQSPATREPPSDSALGSALQRRGRTLPSTAGKGSFPGRQMQIGRRRAYPEASLPQGGRQKSGLIAPAEICLGCVSPTIENAASGAVAIRQKGELRSGICSDAAALTGRQWKPRHPIGAFVRADCRLQVTTRRVQAPSPMGEALTNEPSTRANSPHLGGSRFRAERAVARFSCVGLRRQGTRPSTNWRKSRLHQSLRGKTAPQTQTTDSG